jgi:hypothetical protein|nr:MAG TPA: PaaX-like protein [Bacteriophage sp.]
MINNIIVPDSKSYMDDKQVQAICIAFANGSVFEPSPYPNMKFGKTDYIDEDKRSFTPQAFKDGKPNLSISKTNVIKALNLLLDKGWYLFECVSNDTGNKAYFLNSDIVPIPKRNYSNFGLCKIENIVWGDNFY